MFSLEEIITKSGDSELLSYIYKADILELKIENSELDICINLNIKTNSLITSANILNCTAERTCYLKILRISDRLETKNGYYIAPNDFAKLMKQKKENLHLAYGEKENSEVFLFQLIGSTILLSCMVNKIDDIELQINH